MKKVKHLRGYFLKENDIIYVKEEIKQTEHPILVLTGSATVTHVGANARFKFEHNGMTYTTEYAEGIAKARDHHDNYYNWKGLIFDIDPRKKWSQLYTSIESAEYFKPLPK